MPELIITPNLDLTPWNDLEADPADGSLERVGILPGGMVSGRSTVAFLVRLADGSTVVAETSLKLFRVMARAVLATPIAEGEPLDD